MPLQTTNSTLAYPHISGDLHFIGLFKDITKGKVRLAAGIVSFDDERGLRRCLKSIHDHVDLMIVIDGKFRYFEDDHDISIDNSREVVESFSNSVYCCWPNLTEIDKRNKYLEFAGEMNVEFLLVIDSDEFAVIDKGEFLYNLEKLGNLKMTNGSHDGGGNTDVYGIKIFEKHIEKPNYIRERYIERLFYKPGRLRYQSIHCNLVDVDNPSRNFTTGKYSSEIHGITLYNDDNLRTSNYLKRSIQYQSLLLEGERAARKKIFN
jgi:hypothetical protein